MEKKQFVAENNPWVEEVPKECILLAWATYVKNQSLRPIGKWQSLSPGDAQSDIKDYLWVSVNVDNVYRKCPPCFLPAPPSNLWPEMFPL